MAVNFEDTVFGFDLNYLHQTTDYNLLQSRIEKQRMAILKAKKKTVCTDSLIRKYHEKQQLLEEIEKDFLASKEECKQICIEYKSSLEKCSKLEAETKNLQTINHELENDLRTAKNQQEAILSHSNQLQILIKDYETRLEALKIENQLEKIKPKNNEKKVGCVAKDNSELMKHIQIILDLAVKNNNLNGKDKRLLKKYKKLYKLGESSQDAEDSEDETETYECNEDTEFIIDANKNIQTGKPERNLVEIDRDSNASNEIVSIDTGRGSSLAFSDSDKCFQSPEYFSDDSPPSVDSLSNNKKSYANKSTSPISVRTNNAASSPVKELQILHGFEKQITDVKRNEIATSPVQFNDTDVSCEENTEDYVDTNNPLDDDNSNDCEIETILSSMRLNHNLITPIPSTPSKSRTRTISERSEHVCLEAAKVREENKTLQASLTNLTKEVMNIKSMLKLHFMSNDHDTGHNNYLRAPDDYTPNIHENKAAEIFIANEEAIFDPHSDNESQCSIASLDTVVNELPTTEDDTVLLESSEIVHESSEIVHESSEIVHESSEIDHESSSLMVINDSVPINASRNLSFEEDPEANEVLDNLNNSNNLNISIHERCDALPQIGKKNMRKLTKLQRLRINMLPKGKIPNARSMPQRKLRMKPKQLKMRKKKKPSKNDSSATLNDKDVYEKAVKVMAELKSKKLLQKGKQLALKQANKNNSCDIDVNCNENIVSKSKENIVEIDSQKDKSSVQSSENNTTSIQCTDTVILTPKSPINTQSQSKQVVNEAEVSVKQIQRENLQDENNVGSINEGDNKLTTNHCITQETREKKKSLKRPSLDTPEIENKRVLRSSSAHLTVSYSSQRVGNDAKPCDKSECKERQTNNSHRLDVSAITNYSDLDIFTEEPTVKTAYKTRDAKENVQDGKSRNPQESILCEMLQKYGATKANKNRNKKISESVINSMCKNIQDGIGEIIALPPNETKSAMNALVERLGKCQLKPLLMGLMNYLKDPARKAELFNKVHTSSAPPMTKSEQVLLYILTNLRGNWPGIDFIGCVLDNMEYTLFKLNCTPEFETIESMSHFYAVLCRYMKDKSRLRLFILDAMYCIQFKAVPLIKQCMEVWMHILPLAHLGLAKSPLVMCVVYLLHFFKCEDRFNRVTEIRNILNRKYFYKFSDWSETKILEMFRSSIRELKDDKIETKMLRLALIVLAKRQGPQWCQNNIIKNLLQPMIEDETAPEKVKVFCLSMIGPLLKPYPAEMKVHCEVVMNQLIDSINSTSSVRLQEAIFTSLIYMNKHNPNRVVRALLSWSPKHVTPEMESIFKEFVRGKPLKIWKQQLSRLN